MRTTFAACSLLLAGLAGCGPTDATPSVYPVSGKVLLPDGKPAFGAEVQFLPKTGKDGTRTGAQSSTVLDKEGGFKLTSMGGKDGVPPGTYAVVLNPNLQPPAEKQIGVQTIPKKYWSEDTTDLTTEITGAKSDLVLQLTK